MPNNLTNSRAKWWVLDGEVRTSAGVLGWKKRKGIDRPEDHLRHRRLKAAAIIAKHNRP